MAVCSYSKCILKIQKSGDLNIKVFFHNIKVTFRNIPIYFQRSACYTLQRGENLMLERLAKSTARLFVKNNIADSEYEEVYAYGAEIILSTIINGLAVLIMSVIADTLIPSLVFVISFIFIRRLAGGFHASTHLKCMIILIVVHLIFIIIVKHMDKSIIPYFTHFTILYSCVSVYLFAPVEHFNKHLKDDDIKRLKKLGIGSVMCFSTAIIIMSFLKHYFIALYIAFGMFVSVTGMLIEKARQYLNA